MIQVIDYGAGNLRSVVRALQRLGVATRVVKFAADFDGQCPTILPGVGAAASAMHALQSNGVGSLLTTTRAPLLGICLGMQLQGTHSEEGDVATLGMLSGTVCRLQHVPKIPHMGWNTVQCSNDGHPLFAHISADTHFYFAHSYAVVLSNADSLIATTHYGPQHIVAAWGNSHCVGVQFHPEKSGDAGMQLLRNFCAWAGET